ncbi:uncharacterized protein LOC118761863 [Octopus sinensis]|uniref:Uncharacterized protein LOC118761863 n=1 Tax=Octopus sinensis TaxID=2607531 RepID=A0A7E6EKQ2_9MOLL|nr:uncharacterized protein LOC118761863 [Octopus sinensis]
MSRGYNAFVRGSRRSFSLPTNMVTTTTTTTTMMMMMMMMIISVMILPCSSLNRVEMTSLKPYHGFGSDGPSRMKIECSFEAKNLVFFRLKRNDEVVVDIGYNKVSKDFVLLYAKENFGCTLPQAQTTKGEVHCWKKDLDCSDVASYSCEISNANKSNSRILKVKSFIASLAALDKPYKKAKTPTFRCLAYVSPAPRDEFVTFRWIIKYKKPNVEQETTVKRVPLLKTGQRCIVMKSLYKHMLTDKDKDGTIIACSAFGDLLSQQVTKERARSGSPISALPDTAWFSVSKISLLFLALASYS